MNTYEVNPFQVLYVTDSADPRAFVNLFSDIPVVHASALFELGNVVLKGTQGSGKSMLLNLLHPAIRLEYARASHPFPVSVPQFIGAGINLTLSGALNIGQRPIQGVEEEEQLFPFYFADYLNYFVFADLLNSLSLMSENSKYFDFAVDGSRLDDFASEIACDDCWFGYMNGCRDFTSLRSRIVERLTAYRRFHQYNGDLPLQISESKTGIGEPLSRAVDALRGASVIGESTPFFVRIDQIERLYRSDVLRPNLGKEYRRIINKAIGGRDSRVSYRIGARTYAWNDDLTIYGTADQLEALRDYRQIDLDDMLRRKEDKRTWIFPAFAADAFQRRMNLAGISHGVEKSTVPNLLTKVFGQTPPPDVLAREVCRNTTAERALKLGEEFSEEWRTLLGKLFEEDPLEAALAAAWARQGKDNKRLKSLPPTENLPWQKKTWRVERLRIAVLQLAARCAQRLKWSGNDAVLALSSGNISIFLNLCYEVWDCFLRSERLKPANERVDPVVQGIPHTVQAVGIQTASTHWFSKIVERPKGHDRQRFIEVVAKQLRSWLVDDLAMSYPGHNGFSLVIDELQNDGFVEHFLNEAVDYGDLFDAMHTTKEKTRRSRRKWYIAPILSVHFQIPEVHKKEPYYAGVAEVRKWLSLANINETKQLEFSFDPIGIKE